jgi:phosphopentomutase
LAFYVVGEDEFSFSWEMPGVQFTFNKEVKYEKAKKIADEIIENISSIGQKAELIVLEKNKVYRFK